MTCNCDLPPLNVGRLDLALKQGADRNIPCTWTIAGVPVPLAGYSMSLALAEYVSAVPMLELSQTPTPGGSVITLSSDNSGTFTVTFGHVDTAALPHSTCGHPVALYDLKYVTPSGTVGYLYQGYVYVSAEITP